jgi:hypothetical protein
MPISVIQRTRAIGFLLSLDAGKLIFGNSRHAGQGWRYCHSIVSNVANVMLFQKKKHFCLAETYRRMGRHFATLLISLREFSPLW